MDNAEKQSIPGILIIVLVAAGLAWAGSQGGFRVFGMSLFALSVALAFVIQWVAFIPAFARKTETFFDLTGGITYITVVVTAVILSPTVDGRSLLLLALISIWAIRLASFLFLRIRAAGEDRRFREIKLSFTRFLLTWTIQGLWVSFSLAAALAAITAETRLALGGFAWIGLIVWLIGFGIEVLADRQKSNFKAQPENEGKFIRDGLWSWSRHPNYFGEIIVDIIKFPILKSVGCDLE